MMIPASVIVEEGVEINNNIPLVADHTCYTGAKIGGTVFGDITVAKTKGCDEWFPSNVHVCINSTGLVVGNIFADEVIVCSGGKVTGNIVAKIVTVEPGAIVEGKITAHKVRDEYIQPLFLREYDDPTAVALKKLEEKILN